MGLRFFQTPLRHLTFQGENFYYITYCNHSSEIYGLPRCSGKSSFQFTRQFKMLSGNNLFVTSIVNSKRRLRRLVESTMFQSIILCYLCSCYLLNFQSVIQYGRFGETRLNKLFHNNHSHVWIVDLEKHFSNLLIQYENIKFFRIFKIFAFNTLAVIKL